MNSEVRAEDLKGKDYDAVIVAVGAEPVIPKFAKGREDVVWVGDVELGKVSAKKQVVIRRRRTLPDAKQRCLWQKREKKLLWLT